MSEFPTNLNTRSTHLRGVVDFFDEFSEAAVASIKFLYAVDVYFRDPFQEVRGIAELERIFGHMYVTLHEPKFQIIETIEQGSDAFLTWDFVFRFKRFSPTLTRTIRGSSHLKFNADGKVVYHRDYWDAADMYNELPIIGKLMRALKRRVAEG